MPPETSSAIVDLTRLIEPRSIALVGASERASSIGGRTLINLTQHSDLRGPLLLVNRTRSEIAGRTCYPSVADLPLTPDVAVIAVPAPGVPDVLQACANRGVPFAIVLTGGFGEASEEGRALERQLLAIARSSGLRIYGPNCPGLTNVNRRIGMTFSPAYALDQCPGPIGLVTQGGGCGRTIVQAMERGIGVGVWCSTGNEVDLEASDFIRYFAHAPDVGVIVTILEGIRDGARFLAAALYAASRGKPVVALKIGRSEYGVRAAQSHTASIAGSAEINSAVFRQCGVIEVDDLDELIDTAALLVRRRPTGNERVAIYSFSGGADAMAADAVGACGLSLARFSSATTEVLRQHLPAYAAIDNPVDTTAELIVNTGLCKATLKAVADDADVGVVLFPVPMEYGEVTTRACESLVAVQREVTVPLIPVWMSDRSGDGLRRCVDAGIVPVRSIGKAVKAVRRWVDYGRQLAAMDTAWRPIICDGVPQSSRILAQEPLTLSESEGKALLAAGGVPVPRGVVARTVEEALEAVRAVGFPVVLKIVSRSIAHKSDVGGVRIGLTTGEAVRSAWHEILAQVRAARVDALIEGLLVEAMAPPGGAESIVAVHRDPVFGHVMSFGPGGVLAELLGGTSRRLLPVTESQALGMIAETPFARLIAGYRNQPARDLGALARLMAQLSSIVAGDPDRIEELEINPVWIGREGEGVLALDALVVVRD